VGLPSSSNTASVGTIVIDQNTRADAYTQHLGAVHNHWYSHTLCFTQMHLRSNHRRDLSAALRCHIIQFTILGSISTIQNISSSLSMLFGHIDVKHIRQHCKHNIVDTFTHSYCCICYIATYRYKYPTM